MSGTVDTTNTQTITFQVPKNAVPGDTLTLSIDGHDMELMVPEGTEPGDTLQIQVAASTAKSSEEEGHKEEEEDEGKSCGGHGRDSKTRQIIDLGDGRTLDLSSEFLPTDDDDDDKVGNTCENDGTFAHPWRSSIEIATRWKEIISQNDLTPFSSSPKRIVELGAGLGLMGMSYAIDSGSINKQENAGDSSDNEMATTITLTDLPAALHLLNRNIEQHKHMFPTTTRVRSCPLRWTLDDSNANEDCWTKNEPPFDGILGSDLLYNVEYIPHLVATCKRLLHPTRGIFVYAARWRKPELEREFFQSLDGNLEWKTIKLSSSKGIPFCDLSWKEFGNPSSAASNKYFHQTQILVHGKLKSLADITQDDTKNFTTEEYDAWDRAYIQFYIGKPKSISTRKAL